MSDNILRGRFAQITISQIESYLIARNWINEGTHRNVATIWHRRDSTDAELVLPLHEQLKDYTQRLIEVFDSLASFEGRPATEISDDIARVASHLVSVRVIHDDTEGGTIPINDGVLLIQRAKDLLLSAVMSMYGKKRHFAGRPPKNARPYLDSLLLGQTEVGSYVVNVIAPVGTTIEPEPFALDHASEVGNTPFASAVTGSLASSLEALTRAIDDYAEHDDITVFDDAVIRGASANMCDALLGFSGRERKRSFEIRIAGAPTPLFSSAPRVFHFDAHSVTRLRKASEYFKDNYVLPDRTITGFIKRLDRPRGQDAGTVTVASVIAKIEKNVIIELDQEDYDRAILAHRAKELVECSGDVHVSPRTAHLMSPHGFRVIPNNNLFELP